MDRSKIKPGMRIIEKKKYTGTYSDYRYMYLILSIDKEHKIIWVADCTLTIFKMSCASMAQYKVVSIIETEDWNKIIRGEA